jgi:WS/DGAT/MGAT family acyltransferase
MAGVDAVWLAVEAPENLMVVTVVLRFGGAVDWDRFAVTVGERMVRPYPAFVRRAVSPSRPFHQAAWTEDPGFDLGAHLRRKQLPAGVDQLAALVSDLLARPLDMSRSPWELHLVDQPEGSTVVARLHHCLADGLALAAVLLSLTDPQDGADVAGATGAGTGGPDRPSRRVRDAAQLAASVVTTGLGILFAAREPRTSLRGQVGTRKSAAWSEPLALDVVKGIGRALGVSVNDVLLAMTAGALRRHLAASGERPQDVRIFVPVDLRPRGEPVPTSLGNRFGVVFVQLPVSVADPVERVHAVHQRMSRAKASAQARATFAMLGVLGVLPAWGHRLAVRLLGAKSTAVVTNVAGPQDPVSVAGSPLSGVVFWVPQAGSVGLGISILSYAGTVTVGVAADHDLVPDPRLLADAFERDLAELAGRAAALR